MKILKKYLIVKWLKSFIASFLVLFTLITVANLLTGLLRNNVTVSEVLANYFIQIFNYLSLIVPVSSLTASIFSINKIKSQNELTAIFSVGMSRSVFLNNIFTASLFIGILSFLALAFVGPKVASYKSKLIKNPGTKFLNLKKQGLITSTIGSGYFWYKSDDYFVSFKKYDHIKKQISFINLYKLKKNGLLDKVIKSDNVEYIANKWVSKSVSYIESLSDEKITYQKTQKKFTFPIREKTTDLLRLSADISTLNIIKLSRYITNLEKAGLNTNTYKIILYSSINIIFICVLLALIASIDIFKPNRRSSSTGKSIGFIFVFTIIYWLMRSYLVEMGKTSKISAELAIFSMPVFLTLFLTMIIIKNRKLT